MAYLAFANQQASFKNYTLPAEIDKAISEEANRTMETAIAQFNSQFED